MPVSFTIDITMTPATVTQLQNNGFNLIGFSGVNGPIVPSAFPTVWFVTDSYSANTSLNWQQNLGGYTSTQTNPAPGTTITASFSTPMSVGDQLEVTAGGVGTIVAGAANEISIHNTTATPFSCGLTLSQPGDSSQAAPICSFPLLGNTLDAFQPVELVFLMFATDSVDTGTVIEQSFSEGILVNMTGQTGIVPLTFDIGNGWTRTVLAEPQPPNASLGPLLINNANPPGAASTQREQRRLQARA